MSSPDIPVVVLQLVASVAAAVGLFVLWRRFEAGCLGVRVVALGFVVRAALSVSLFWISWLGLSLGRSLQLGNGLWFFGLDGQGYFNHWIGLLMGGGVSALFVPVDGIPAYRFVQVLALSKSLFGPAVSSAFVLNMGSYVGTAMLVVGWANRVGRREGALVPLAALSLYPSGILWSTQPLKDTFLCFCAVLFICVVERVLEAVEARSTGRLVGWLTIEGLVLHLIWGVRWQYGVVLLAAFVPVFGWVFLSSLERRKARVVVLLLVAFVIVLAGSTVAAVEKLMELFSRGMEYVALVRFSFDYSYRPATVIEPGGLIVGWPFAQTLSRAAMTFLPRFVTSAAGLATAGGGRGLWALAEVDTLWFGAVLLWVGRLVWISRPLQIKRNPMIAFLVLLFLTTTPILYMINNFGTLMRFRLLLLLPIALLPLTLPVRSGEDAAGARRPTGEAAGLSASESNP